MTQAIKPPTEVAVGLVFSPQGQVLFAQRPQGKPYAGWWEFPGGKLEAGESVEAALTRELHEELGLHIHTVQRWITRTHVYAHATVRLHFCKVADFSGQPQSLEAQAFTWSDVATPTVAPILPGALPMLPWLTLPDTLQLSEGARNVKNLNDAVLLDRSALAHIDARPAARWVGALVTGVEDLARADKLHFDFAVAPADAAFDALAAQTPVPLYALAALAGQTQRATMRGALFLPEPQAANAK
jgi:8-oxo-dGTP diphosphatase